MTRSTLTTLILTATAIAVSACAATGDARPNSYRADLDRLTADCRERGGILSPTGATTGRPETEFACRISGASRID